jgi:uncharacterized protein YacL
MSDAVIAILVAIALLIFGGVGVVLLVWPSKFLRHFQNPLQPDTPVSRVQMRGVGFMLCLLILMIISASVSTLNGFHKNVLLALWTSPIFIAFFLWMLWRYSSLQKVNRRYLAGEADDSKWELRMSVAFCSLFSLVVVAAFLLARSGIYPK